MSKTKVLVTGANGYIGRHVVEQLLNMGADVLAADSVLMELMREHREWKHRFLAA